MLNLSNSNIILFNRLTSHEKGEEMRIRFLVSVIVCVGLSVDSGKTHYCIHTEILSKFYGWYSVHFLFNERALYMRR